MPSRRRRRRLIGGRYAWRDRPARLIQPFLYIGGEFGIPFIAGDIEGLLSQVDSLNGLVCFLARSNAQFL